MWERYTLTRASVSLETDELHQCNEQQPLLSRLSKGCVVVKLLDSEGCDAVHEIGMPSRRCTKNPNPVYDVYFYNDPRLAIALARFGRSPHSSDSSLLRPLEFERFSSILPPKNCLLLTMTLKRALMRLVRIKSEMFYLRTAAG